MRIFSVSIQRKVQQENFSFKAGKKHHHCVCSLFYKNLLLLFFFLSLNLTKKLWNQNEIGKHKENQLFWTSNNNRVFREHRVTKKKLCVLDDPHKVEITFAMVFWCHEYTFYFGIWFFLDVYDCRMIL